MSGFGRDDGLRRSLTATSHGAGERADKAVDDVLDVVGVENRLALLLEREVEQSEQGKRASERGDKRRLS